MRGGRKEEKFGGRVPAALCICLQDSKCMLPCDLQGLVSHWLALGAPELEWLKKTVLQPSREQREREGAALLHQLKGDEKHFSSGTLNTQDHQEALSNYSDSLKRSLQQGV